MHINNILWVSVPNIKYIYIFISYSTEPELFFVKGGGGGGGKIIVWIRKVSYGQRGWGF